MKLSDYLAGSGIDESAFAVTLGVSAKAVRHWLLGKRTPRPLQMQSIRKATAGAVTPNDFLPPSLATSEAPSSHMPSDCEAAE